MKGKVAVVTASSTGIGKAVVERLGEEGCRVVVSSRKQNHVDQTVQQLKKKGIDAIGCVCHVGKAADRANLLEFTIKNFGRIDYLVLNAAVSTHMGNFFQAEEDQLKKMWDINLISSFMLVRETLPYLKKQPGSSIVILSSYSGYEFSNVIGHYAITKTALIALAKNLAKQLHNDEIRVNAIAPGLIKTDFSKALWEHGEENVKDAMGINRIGVPRDIANVVKFLLSDQASYISGQCIAAVGRPIARL